MRESVARVVEAFLTEVDAALGSGYSAVLYGSAARGDFVPGRSDINLMLVLDQVDPAGSPLARARVSPAGARRSEEPPLILSRSEWDRATDAFPIEITDMRLSYQVLRGADPVHGVRGWTAADLRKALEREFRGKLLRLRQGYATYAPDPRALWACWRSRARPPSWSCFAACSACIGKPVPGDPSELAAAAAAAVGFEAEHLLHVVRHRAEREWRCGAPGVRELHGGGGTARRGSSTNFSSEISDEAPSGSTLPLLAAALFVTGCGYNEIQTMDETREPGAGPDSDPAPAPSRSDSQPGQHGKGGHQTGRHGRSSR